ncbi:MAG: hypothetical protein ACREVG_04010, partial [Burkholderiales bacterium]
MMNRDEYVQKLKTQLDQWNADVATWEARAKAAQGEMKTAYEQQLTQFRSRRAEAVAQLQRLQAASGQAWSEMTKGVDGA